ncbi:MAG: phosphatase PAP2 family protein [Clostridia bacterium]|nr:phosphatase PAP2 family protein [Clostridia bacterium]
MKRMRNNLIASSCLFTAFALWTVAICFVDVQMIGPKGTSVGFSKINLFFHNLTGVNWGLYNLTDWLGIVPIGVAFSFAILGFVQWIKRKKLVKVDRSLLVLGGFYITVIAVYIFFETVVINYRPVLIEGYLEVSYPSSTALLVMCVMPTAMMQLKARIKNRKFRRCVLFIIALFIAFMVIGRLVSGVHWLTDIIGGVLISSALVRTYAWTANIQSR